MIGKSDFDYFPEEMAREYFNDEQALMKSGTPLVDKREYESSRDGRDVCFSTTKLPLRDHEGNVIGSFGISRDVTLHQKAEDDLRESEALYHSLIENLPVHVIRKDADGRFTVDLGALPAGAVRVSAVLGDDLEPRTARVILDD